MCFIDFEKAINMAWHEALVERVRRLGIDAANLRLITNFYWG